MCWYLFLILGIWIPVSFIMHRYFSRKKNALVKEVFYKKLSNVLFVIAHPDDECMFFGPAIATLVQPASGDLSFRRKKGKDVFVLCLSDGKNSRHSVTQFSFSCNMLNSVLRQVF